VDGIGDTDTEFGECGDWPLFDLFPNSFKIAFHIAHFFQGQLRVPMSQRLKIRSTSDSEVFGNLPSLYPPFNRELD
jgi:hypothetical protein